nr:MAG TPA: hypothetical protein [Caudoviricetes sp.]
MGIYVSKVYKVNPGWLWLITVYILLLVVLVVVLYIIYVCVK